MIGHLQNIHHPKIKTINKHTFTKTENTMENKLTTNPKILEIMKIMIHDFDNIGHIDINVNDDDDDTFDDGDGVEICDNSSTYQLTFEYSHILINDCTITGSREISFDRFMGRITPTYIEIMDNVDTYKTLFGIRVGGSYCDNFFIVTLYDEQFKFWCDENENDDYVWAFTKI